MTTWYHQRLAARRAPPPTEEPNAEGSPLEGYVEHPLDGGAVERRFVVSGWHAWHRAPVAAVVVQMGDVTRRAQASATTRDDVASDRADDGYLHTGWEAEFDLGGVHEASVTMHVTLFPAVDHEGIRLEPRTITFAGPPTIDEEGVPIPVPPPREVRGRLDTPRPGETVTTPALEVSGWATTSYDSPLRSVVVSIGDVELGRARLGVGRLDVAENDPSPPAPVAGFAQLVDLTRVDLPAGMTSVRASVEALDGTTGSLAHDVVLQLETESVPVVDRRRGAGPRPDAPPHVLACTHDLGLGGAQLWLCELLRRTSAGSDYPCTVVSFAGGELADQLRHQGVEVHVTSALPVNDLASYEGRLEELDAWLGDRPFTGAIVNTFRAFPCADLAARKGLPVVWAIHESWPERLIWSFDHPGVAVDPEVRGLAGWALGAAGAVVFESEATRALYEDRAPSRTLVVPFGVDTAELDRFAATTDRAAARRALGLEESDRRLALVMGTIEPRKGQGLVVQAFGEVAERHRDLDLVLVGDLHTSYSGAIKEFVERTGLTKRVLVEDVTRDANLWYRACDALVCASDVESMPRSVLDAMCLGLPVLATSVFGLEELLRDGETGLLFEPMDLVAAIDALDRLCTMDPGELAAIAARGSDLVHERHDSSGYSSDVLTLLAGLRRDPAALPSAILADGGTSRPAYRSST